MPVTKNMLATVGLALAALGSLLLTRFNKSLTEINPDGSVRIGPTGDMSGDVYRAKNRVYMQRKKICVPLAYWLMFIGFTMQFIASVM